MYEEVNRGAIQLEYIANGPTERYQIAIDLIWLVSLKICLKTFRNRTGDKREEKAAINNRYPKNMCQNFKSIILSKLYSDDILYLFCQIC